MEMQYGSIWGSIRSQAGWEPIWKEPIYRADNNQRAGYLYWSSGTWPSNHSKRIAKYKSRGKRKIDLPSKSRRNDALISKLWRMVDIELLIKALRKRGHTVQDVHHVPENAGEYGLIVDGNGLNLEGARRLLELDEQKK